MSVIRSDPDSFELFLRYCFLQTIAARDEVSNIAQTRRWKGDRMF